MEKVTRQIEGGRYDDDQSTILRARSEGPHRRSVGGEAVDMMLGSDTVSRRHFEHEGDTQQRLVAGHVANHLHIQPTRRHQTSPPVLPPGESFCVNARLASPFPAVQARQMRRRPENRKYVTCPNAARVKPYHLHAAYV